MSLKIVIDYFANTAVINWVWRNVKEFPYGRLSITGCLSKNIYKQKKQQKQIHINLYHIYDSNWVICNYKWNDQYIILYSDRTLSGW